MATASSSRSPATAGAASFPAAKFWTLLLPISTWRTFPAPTAFRKLELTRAATMACCMSPGATTATAVWMNSDSVHDGADQFFQWLAVDPPTGAANVIFYDRREDAQNVKTKVTLA